MSLVSMSPSTAPTVVLNPFGAQCGGNAGPFNSCVTSTLGGFPSAETYCSSLKLQTPGAIESCLCAASNSVITCYNSGCANDPTLSSAVSVQNAYCTAAVRFSATSVVTAIPTGVTVTRSQQVANTTIVVNTNSAKSVGYGWSIAAFVGIVLS
ncbi:hypothetical protein BC830DRAFT_1092402 [Chytriomyces sp. MP71]|nr:hypothetical protein BC830DRAFT_1092402 [Chytriomyces sp. MP71]